MFEKFRKRLVSWTPVIALLSLIVTIAAMFYPSISLSISSYFISKADYSIDSVTIPTILSNDFRQSLSVSTEYIVVTSVNLKSNTPYQGDPLQLSISYENEGKKSVKQPRVSVYFVDFMFRVWNVWNESLTNDKLTEGFSLEYHFPPLDEKIVGNWIVFVLLYDDVESVLVSYVLKTFAVTDVAPQPWWQPFLLLGLLLLAAIVLIKFDDWRVQFRDWRRGKKK